MMCAHDLIHDAVRKAHAFTMTHGKPPNTLLLSDNDLKAMDGFAAEFCGKHRPDTLKTLLGLDVINAKIGEAKVCLV